MSLQNLEKYGGSIQAKEAAKNIAKISIKYSLNAIHQRNKDFGDWCRTKSNNKDKNRVITFNKDMFTATGVIT